MVSQTGNHIPASPALAKRVLDIGCGKNKAAGAIGMDSNFDATDADVIADVNSPLPFPDSAFDEVRAVHIIEHARDPMKTIAEIHRVTRNGGGIYLATPHYTDAMSWRDPTHYWHLNSYSFDYYHQMRSEQGCWYTRLELRQKKLHLELAKIWKWLGLQWLVNHSLRARRFWELYLCFVCRGKHMEFWFEVVK